MISLQTKEATLLKNITLKTETPADIVRLENVSKTFPGQTRPAVAGVSLWLKPGELLALLGPSGCGKTTTLRLMAGFERPDSGQVVVNGQLVAGAGRWLPPEKRQLGMVFQDYALFPHLSVNDNIAFGLRHLTNRARQQRVAELLEMVGLSGFEKRYPHQLSGGQQQRVAIARALAPRPTALLLDEAFNSLDAAIQASMHREVRAILKAEGVAAVLVTHNQQEAFSLADRMAVLNKGAVEQVGPPEEVFRRPASRFVAGFVGKANFLPARLERGRLFCELGLLPCPPDYAASEQSNLEVLLRPHEIELHPAYSEAGAAATIVNRTYFGPDSLYTVRLASTDQPLDIVSTADFQPGETVKLKAEPHFVSAFEPESQR